MRHSGISSNLCRRGLRKPANNNGTSLVIAFQWQLWQSMLNGLAPYMQDFKNEG
jgi:hypothetical protein